MIQISEKMKRLHIIYFLYLEISGVKQFQFERIRQQYVITYSSFPFSETLLAGKTGRDFSKNIFAWIADTYK